MELICCCQHPLPHIHTPTQFTPITPAPSFYAHWTHENWTWIHIATSHFCEHKHNPMQIFGLLLLLTIARIIVLVTIVIFGVLHIIRKSNFVYKHLLPRCQLFSSYARSYMASTMHELRSNINSFETWLQPWS